MRFQGPPRINQRRQGLMKRGEVHLGGEQHVVGVGLVHEHGPGVVADGGLDACCGHDGQRVAAEQAADAWGYQGGLAVGGAGYDVEETLGGGGGGRGGEAGDNSEGKKQKGGLAVGGAGYDGIGTPGGQGQKVSTAGGGWWWWYLTEIPCCRSAR